MAHQGKFTGSVGTAQVFVDRGDPSAWDAGIGSGITADGNFNDLDLSSVVGTGSRLVLFRYQFTDNLTSTVFQIRKNGQSNAFNSHTVNGQASSVVLQGDCWCYTDSSGIVEVKVSSGVSTANLCVRGWFEDA